MLDVHLVELLVQCEEHAHRAHILFPSQLEGRYTESDLLDKHRKVSSLPSPLLPPCTRLHFYRAQGA